MRIDVDTRPWFEIGDRDDLSYEEKLRAYRLLADEHFQADAYAEFCAGPLAHLDEAAHEWFTERRVRPRARGHGALDVPVARARAVRRALPRPARCAGRATV